MRRPCSTHDLSPGERRFVQAMTHLAFGRFEFLRIERGEISLAPWPTSVRDVKFGAQDPGVLKLPPHEFTLKPQVADLFEYVRSIDAGEIRALEIQHGLPFSMEIEHRPEGGDRG